MKKLIPCFVPAVVLAVFTALVPAQADEPKLYTAKITKKLPVGTEFSVESKAKMDMQLSVTVDGSTLVDESENVDGNLTGDFKILAADDKGQTTKYSIAIKSLVLKSEGKDTLEVADKEMIVEKQDKKTTYTIGGDPADEETTKSLDVLISFIDDIPPEGIPTDDEAFCFDKPRKVGETWKADALKLAKSLNSELPVLVDAEGLDVDCRLGDVEKIHGQECLRVSIKGVIPVKEIKDLGLPVKMKDSTLHIELEAASSQDEKIPNPEEKMAVHLTAQGSGKSEGKDLGLSMKLNAVAESKIKLKN